MWGAGRETPSKLNKGKQIFCSLIYLFLGGCFQVLEQQKHREIWLSWLFFFSKLILRALAHRGPQQGKPTFPTSQPDLSSEWQQPDLLQLTQGLPLLQHQPTAPILGGSKSWTLGVPQRQTHLASSAVLPWPAVWPGACFLTSLSFLEPLKQG